MIDLKNINKDYKRNKKTIQALKNVNLHFENNGFVCITGPSGSGKTTLLNIIYGSVKQTSGEIYHNNIPYKKSKIENEISYIFQEYNLIENLNVYDNINLALKLNGIERTKDEIEEKLIKLGLNDVLYAYPYELSGGQQQRVAIARASLSNSNIILADEPTGALDEETAKDVMNLLKEESKNKLIILVSHNKNLIKLYADHIIEMNDGKIILDNIVNEVENVELIEQIKKNKNGFKYLLNLGFKYINFKSFKLYLSLLMMIISFTLLILTISIMLFNPEKSYDSINDKKYNYTLIQKYEKIDSINNRSINSTKEEIGIFTQDYSLIYNFGFEVESVKKKEFVYATITYNKNIINNLNYNLIGDLPKENELLITKKIMDELEETNYKNIQINANYKVSGYIEFYYEKNDNDYVDLNNALYINGFDYERDYYLLGAITEKLSYNDVLKINDYKCSKENCFYKCNSICLDSIERANSFANVMKEIGIPVSVLLCILTIIILINYVSGIIENNKNDAKIIKMIGGNNKDLSIIFSIQPLLIIVLSMFVSYILYFIIKERINLYLISEFKMFIPILFLSIWKNIIIILGVVIIFFLSIIIPIKKIKFIK